MQDNDNLIVALKKSKLPYLDEEELSEDITACWLDSIANATAITFSDEILNIQQIPVNAQRQLIIDIGKSTPFVCPFCAFCILKGRVVKDFFLKFRILFRIHRIGVRRRWSQGLRQCDTCTRVAQSRARPVRRAYQEQAGACCLCHSQNAQSLGNHISHLHYIATFPLLIYFSCSSSYSLAIYSIERSVAGLGHSLN